MTPVLASVGFNNTPPVQQIPIANSQDVLRKAQEDAKVFLYRSCDIYLNFNYVLKQLGKASARRNQAKNVR